MTVICLGYSIVSPPFFAARFDRIERIVDRLIQLVLHLRSHTHMIRRMKLGRTPPHRPQRRAHHSVLHALKVTGDDGAEIRDAERAERQHMIGDENQPDHHTVQAEHPGQEHERKAQQAQGQRRIVSRRRERTDRRQRNHDDRDRRDEAGGHGSLPDDKDADDRQCTPDLLGQAQRRFAQHLHRRFHDEHLDDRRERDAGPAARYGDGEFRRDELRVVGDDRHIQARRDKRERQRQQPGQADEADHDEALRIILGRLVELAEHGRGDQGEGRAVHHDDHPAFEQVRHRLVRPFRILQLREGRIMVVLDVLLKVSDIQDSVRIDRSETPVHLLNKRFIGDAVEVADRHTGLGHAPDLDQGETEAWRRQPISQQRDVRVELLDEAFPWTADHLLGLRLGDRALGDASRIEQQPLAEPVHDNDRLPPQNAVEQRLQLGLRPAAAMIQRVVENDLLQAVKRYLLAFELRR